MLFCSPAYFCIAHWSRARAGLVAVATLAILAVINALGVREGATTQNVLTALKLGALVALVAAGLFVAPRRAAAAEALHGSVVGAFTSR